MAIKSTRLDCAHCGLPIPAGLADTGTGDFFCCHACRLVAAIIGKQEQGDHAWNLLRFGFGALLAMNIMMISLLLYSGSVETQSEEAFRLVLLGLAAVALAVLIPPFLAGAIGEFRKKKMSLDVLIAGGSLSAFAVSAVNVVKGSGHIYFDTATMLPVLVTLGKMIEASAKTRAADLLLALESLLPATALRVTSEGDRHARLDELQPGDMIRVRVGERIAVDGTIVEGASTIEEAAFSGEFLPRLCRPGDRVIAGTTNGAGTLLVQAEKTGEDLLLHGIVTMIHDAWRTPSKAERIAERAAAFFIPAVLLISAGSFVFWSLTGNPEQGLLSALSVLVVACPCTMGIATPLATSLAITRAAKAGLIVRGGSVMERIAGTEIIFFDKTGTITTGCPRVQKVQNIDTSLNESELLGRLAALEADSEHPLGRAIVSKARTDGVDTGTASAVRVWPGSGISGRVTWHGETKEVAAGTGTFIEKEAKPHVEEGSCTIVHVAWDGELRGRVLLTDAPRPDAGRCIAELRRQGITSVLLSGDRYPAAAAIAERVGFDRVDAPRDPAQKCRALSSAMAAGQKVAMVGDGINDAPALATAHTGIALGGSMDLAKQAGDVIILSECLMHIPWLISLSKRTGSIIRGNFAWSFGYNSLALAAAATGLLHPLLAALSMVVSSLTVLGNSLRITAFPDSISSEKEVATPLAAPAYK